MSDWLVVHKDIIETLGVVGGLVFTGLALHVDARVRRAQTRIELTKQHRELWIYFDEHPDLEGLFDEKRDMRAHPLSEKEARFANFLFLHLEAAYGAKKARIFVLPERTGDDWRELFSYPAVLAAWDGVSHLHDKGMNALVAGYRSPARSDVGNVRLG